MRCPACGQKASAEIRLDAMTDERDLLREGHRLIKGFAEHIRDNAGNANLVRRRAGNIIRWIEINVKEADG